MVTAAGARQLGLAVGVGLALTGCGRMALTPQGVAADRAVAASGRTVRQTPLDVPIPPLAGRLAHRQHDSLQVMGMAATAQATQPWFLRSLAADGWSVGAAGPRQGGGFALSAFKGRRDLWVEAVPVGASSRVRVTIFDPPA